jgi:shikimate dehydrogenase
MTDKYCVIGNPIAQSRSPMIHAAFAAATGEDISYERLLAPVEGFADTIGRLIAEGYKGANVTVPFKIEAAQLATRMSDRGRAAGAVNLLAFRDGEIYADNTDGAGLVADITRNAGVPLAGKRVLILGAGGGARGVILPILTEGARELVLANRTRATAENLAAQFGGKLKVCDFGDIDAPFDVVINATAASMAGEVPPIPAITFCQDTLAFDMMYAKNPTVFMDFAAAHGATVRDGLGMLVEQAAEAFTLWRGVRPGTEQLLRDLRSKL